MLPVNQRPVQTGYHPMHGNNTILSGRYRGYNMTSTPGADGKAWFEGGQGRDHHVYLPVGPGRKEEPKAAPTPSAGPTYHAPSVNHFEGLPDFPNMPKPPKPVVMPVPDDAKVRADKEREIALRRRGRQATILSLANQLN